LANKLFSKKDDNASAIRALALVRARVPHAQLIVAGSGPEKTRLKQLAESLNLGGSVRFTGRVEAADMPALYRSAQVSLNPSRVDNMPNSVLEALAAGVAVVSTRVGGVPYMVEHEKTALWSAGPWPTCQAIVRILTDPAPRSGCVAGFDGANLICPRSSRSCSRCTTTRCATTARLPC
jgi:glycosyltransferase involved in cell wall biosynthesis